MEPRHVQTSGSPLAAIWSLNPANDLGECWQFHQIILGDGFERLPGLAPGGEPADDHERVEPFFPQQMRHPGAGRFACSSTVEVNVFIFRKSLDLFFEIVGFDADRTFDALRSDVVVAVAAHVDDLYSI